MRLAVLIVGSVFAIAATVGLWPVATPALPPAPRAGAPALPASLAIALPAEVPPVGRERTVRVHADAAFRLEAEDATSPESVSPLTGIHGNVFPETIAPEMPVLPSRTFAIEVPLTLSSDGVSGPATPPGVVTRVFATAGRQISGAVRTASSAVRSVF